KTRTWLLETIADLSPAELNKIPAGFNNNIIWNLTHLIAAQQGLCYVRAGLNPVVEEKYFSDYKSGTKPEAMIDSAEIENIKKLLFTSLDQLEADYKNNLFTNYGLFKTRYGAEIASVDDAINFLPYHEGMHAGYITALKKIVKK
ncbi:MAG: DinB family protein, partial [Ferruginibacter sp.]